MKKEFEKAEIEIIRFEKDNDVITTSSIEVTGANPGNTPGENPPIPWS